MRMPIKKLLVATLFTTLTLFSSPAFAKESVGEWVWIGRIQVYIHIIKGKDYRQLERMLCAAAIVADRELEPGQTVTMEVMGRMYQFKKATLEEEAELERQGDEYLQNQEDEKVWEFRWPVQDGKEQIDRIKLKHPNDWAQKHPEWIGK